MRAVTRDPEYHFLAPQHTLDGRLRPIGSWKISFKIETVHRVNANLARREFRNFTSVRYVVNATIQSG